MINSFHTADFNRTANPKSANFTSPLPFIRILSLFISNHDDEQF